MAAAVHPLRHEKNYERDRVIEDRDDNDRGRERERDRDTRDQRDRSADDCDDNPHEDHLDSEVKSADYDGKKENGNYGTPTHQSTERMDGGYTRDYGEKGYQGYKGVYQNSPQKKTSDKSDTRRMSPQHTGSAPDSPKKEKENERTQTPKEGTPVKKPQLPIAPYYPRTRDIYMRTASSEEDELREIYEQQRLNKEKVIKKPELITQKKGEKKAGGKKDDKKGDKERDEDKEKEKKRKEKERRKKRRDMEKTTVTRDSYQNDSRRDAKSKTKVCAVM